MCCQLELYAANSFNPDFTASGTTEWNRMLQALGRSSQVKPDCCAFWSVVAVVEVETQFETFSVSDQLSDQNHRFTMIYSSKNRKFVCAKSRVLHVVCPAEAIDITKEDLMKDDASSPGPAETNEHEVLPAVHPRCAGVVVFGTFWDLASGLKMTDTKTATVKGTGEGRSILKSLHMSGAFAQKLRVSPQCDAAALSLGCFVCCFALILSTSSWGSHLYRGPQLKFWLATSRCLFPYEVTFEPQLKGDPSWRFFQFFHREDTGSYNIYIKYMNHRLFPQTSGKRSFTKIMTIVHSSSCCSTCCKHFDSGIWGTW